MSKQPEDFDFEATCRALEGAAGSTSEGTREAIEVAAYALHFLYATDQFKAFREYLREVREPLPSTVHVEREFTDMEQAEAWLFGHPPPAQETRVSVAGRTYAVWSHEGMLRLVPAPSPQESEE
jgi:hypothetical protein